MKRGSDRSEKIMNAADGLFCEAGFDGTSVRDIAERAGVNKALVFYYYDNKEALFAQVVQRYYDAHHAALALAFEGGGTLAERTHRLMDAYIDYINEHRGFPHLIQRRITGASADMELIRRGLSPLFEWTQRALEEVTPAEGHLAARHFFMTFSGAVITFFTNGAVLTPMWGSDPFSEQGIEERRAHLHWLVDTVLAGLSDSTS